MLELNNHLELEYIIYLIHVLKLNFLIDTSIALQISLTFVLILPYFSIYIIVIMSSYYSYISIL